LVPLLEHYGLKTAFADGNDSLSMRQKKVEALVADQTDVLLCTGIFQEGLDIPRLRSVVQAQAKESAITVLQRMGRGMRIAAGKGDFELWDVFDEGQPILARHARSRRAAYEREGHEVEVL
jgi:superfamily II DNA or RNA helicase